MKKVFAIFSVIAMIAIFSSCGPKQSESQEQSNDSTQVVTDSLKSDSTQTLVDSLQLTK